MIRWYDYPAAIAFAYLIMYFFFTIPVFGAIITYVVYEYGWGWYCNYRLEQEENR